MSTLPQTAGAEPRAPHRGPVSVVGFDGSALARHALRYAARRAAPADRLVLVFAQQTLAAEWPGGLEGGGAAPALYVTELQHRERQVEQLWASVTRQDVGDVPYETLTCDGPPAQVLAAVAADRNADEIVVGTHGHGALRAVLGSVSHALLHEADRPVVVVPAPPGAED